MLPDDLSDLEALRAGKRVVFYDAECRLCRGAVRFIVRRDPRAGFVFASLDTPLAKRVLRELAPPGWEEKSSMLLLEARADAPKLWLRSDAALRIAGGLRFPWPAMGVFRVLPRFLRDPLYRLIARYRYRFFGKVPASGLPVPETPERFLEAASEIADVRAGVCKI